MVPLDWLHDVKTVKQSQLAQKNDGEEKVRAENISLKCSDGRRSNGRKAGTKFKFANLDTSAEFIEAWYKQDKLSLSAFCRANNQDVNAAKVSYQGIGGQCVLRLTTRWNAIWTTLSTNQRWTKGSGWPR
jgi:hypothetical protein